MAKACLLLAVMWVGFGCVGVGAHAQDAAGSRTPAPAGRAEGRQQTCTVDSLPPNPAETALNKGDYVPAEKLLQDLLAKSADDSVAHEELVRALIGQDKVDAAAKDAEAWAAGEPTNSLALTAGGRGAVAAGRPARGLRPVSEGGAGGPMQCAGLLWWVGGGWTGGDVRIEQAAD